MSSCGYLRNKEQTKNCSSYAAIWLPAESISKILEGENNYDQKIKQSNINHNHRFKRHQHTTFNFISYWFPKGFIWERTALRTPERSSIWSNLVAFAAIGEISEGPLIERVKAPPLITNRREIIIILSLSQKYYYFLEFHVVKTFWNS